MSSDKTLLQGLILLLFTFMFIEDDLTLRGCWVAYGLRMVIRERIVFIVWVSSLLYYVFSFDLD